ncbi:MAG TPA: M15 family metallopeptidase [Actinomycetota bacterium]|nr:M15 family metallopeptidase [Actinomycetota bacterium]
MSSRAARVGAILAGIAIGVVAAAAAQALVESPAPIRSPRPIPSTTTPGSATPVPTRAPSSNSISLLVWSPGGIPSGMQRRIAALRGVRAVTMVRSQLHWLVESRSEEGTVIDAPSDGRAVPVEVAGIDPSEYARFVPPSERSIIETLGRGNMLLARTESELRGGGEGLRLRFQEGARAVSGVVSDEAAGGYEALVDVRTLSKGVRTYDFVLVLLEDRDRRASVDRRVRKLVGDQVFRTRLQGETPYLRYGDAVLPQMMVKRFFGEFAASPRSDGSLDIDPAWIARNIAEVELPLIGKVSCHRAVVPPLRAALEDVRRAGLGFTVDPGQYAGCFGPRFINRDPNGRISHHAWAIAVDLNASANPFGARPAQDDRLVEIMESHGFTWGGRWLIPDGMHFEWVLPP